MARVIQSVTLAAFIGAFVVGTLYAQDHAAHQQPAPKAAASTAAPPEIFCATMKTGALCPTGTVGVFRLTGDKQKQWLSAVARYNQAILTAIQQLQGDAKTTLTPAQQAQLDKWFDVGVNTQLNQLLASSTR
jgi:hypothetical protein